MDSVVRSAGRDGVGSAADPRWRSGAGLKVLVPGYAQWSWRQRERVAGVVGGPGQEVEWSQDQLRVDGSQAGPGMPFRSSRSPEELRYVVPDDHVLVDPGPAMGRSSRPEGLILIPREQVAGRAWAR